ncbi:hypothetical protein [Hoeflea sp. 108]|jgi:hypothetical protein|uniref:hypothetical protein n=1 Tax=Hoeflea sp. 108 TaxID=1116369 RepID=UPI000378A6BC|nr:hypothetical protein [Hoeflea sp. 108]
MKVIIEFYRTRETDDAHAVVGREVVETTNLANAIEIAHLLSQTLDMPQRPDAMAITDLSGNALFSGIVDGAATKKGHDHDPIRR